MPGPPAPPPPPPPPRTTPPRPPRPPPPRHAPDAHHDEVAVLAYPGRVRLPGGRGAARPLRRCPPVARPARACDQADAPVPARLPPPGDVRRAEAARLGQPSLVSGQ